MYLFQTSFGIPPEGVYTGLIVVLLIIIAASWIVIYYMARRNIRLVDDNAAITKDAIKGFQDVISALNAIREQLQIGDNAIMGKVNDTEDKIYTRILETQAKLDEAQTQILSHLQYLRDRAK